MNQQQKVQQFNLLQIILYHLLPGLPILLVAVVCTNPVWGFGLPIFLSLMMGIIIGLLPVQWGILYLSARKQGVRIRDIIQFTEKKSVIKTLFWAIPCFILALLIFMTVSQIEHPLWTIFNWIPEWFRIDKFNPATQDRGLLFITIGLNFIFNGILGPLTEEAYFRGFLLPRMERQGKAAPFINVILFSLYHLFTPWENITRILALLPFVYTVWYHKNIRIGMVVHCTLNTFSAVGMLVSIIGR